MASLHCHFHPPHCCLQMLKCTNNLVKSLSSCRIQCVSVIFNTTRNLQYSAHLRSSKTITNYQPHLFCCIVCFVIITRWWLLSSRTGSWAPLVCGSWEHQVLPMGRWLWSDPPGRPAKLPGCLRVKEGWPCCLISCCFG